MSKQRNNATGSTISEKLGLGPGVREIKLGSSFTNSKGPSFHTIKYDFKPASVDESKNAVVDIGPNNQVTVTVPHLDGSATPYTVFKGSQRPSKKECVLIIDKTTGEITLEKLCNNIQVKKTRSETNQKTVQPVSTSNMTPEPKSNSSVKKPTVSHTSNKSKKPSFQSSSKLIPSLGGCIPKHSPLHASPSYPSSRSPIRSQHKSSPQSKSPPEHKSPSQQPAGSLPVLGIDDFSNPRSLQQEIPGNSRSTQSENIKPQRSYQDSKTRNSPECPRGVEKDINNSIKNVSTLSESSSDSSSDSESSDSNSDSDTSSVSAKKVNVNGRANGVTSLPVPDQLLKEDLQLSESDVDSD